MNRFKLQVLNYTHSPQGLVYSAMKQCHSSDPVGEQHSRSEPENGQLIVRHLLSGKRGHYGCFEHPSITMNAQYFPHSVMQQLRTHRVGVSFDVQSFRFTGGQFKNVIHGITHIEDAIYLRPVGTYQSSGKLDFSYTQSLRQRDLRLAYIAIDHYVKNLEDGMPIEQARCLVPFDYRQHFVLTVNARSLLHLLDLRYKKDAQLECQKFAELLMDVFSKWMPEVAHWYADNRLGKAILSP